jgi:opacity protein-like surface antigen
VFGQQKAEFGAPSYEIRAIDPAAFPRPAFPNKYMGQEFKANDSLIFGALAFGVDFYDRFGLPLRMELEASTRADAKALSSTGLFISEPGNNGVISILNRSLAYSMHTAFVNVFVDLRNDTRFTPYFGGGVGAAFINGRATITAGGFIRIENSMVGQVLTQTVDFKKRVTQLAWHLDAGISYNLSEKTTIDLNYRYLNLGKSVKFGDIEYGYSDNQYTGAQVILKGPPEIKFDPTHQTVLGFRYSFL